MRFLKEGDKCLVKNIDSKVKNKWSWKWICQSVERQFDRIGPVKYTLGECIEKIDIYMLSGAGPSTVNTCTSKNQDLEQPTKKFFPMFQSQIKAAPKECTTNPTIGSGSNCGPVLAEQKADPLVAISDQTFNTEAMILGFIAEHSLPLSIAASLAELIQEASKDPKALPDLALSKQTASYKMNFGIAKTFSDEIVAILRSTPFSLNMDEATNDHGKKVLSLIVSFFDETIGNIAVHHLNSVELVKTDSKSIHQAIVNTIEEKKIPWNSLVSVLLDSCNVMRGTKSGVEILLKEKCSMLLDIDGDSCHHVHNITKALCEPFDFRLESLFIDLHLDFKYCTQYRKIMAEMCRICSVNFTAPKCFVSHRWLNAYDQAIETTRLFDIYAIFYSAFLPLHLKGQYAQLLDSLVQKIDTHGARQRMRNLLITLRGKQPITSFGKKRKDRILTRIFYEQDKTLLQLRFYQASIFQMKKFVLHFQTKAPLIHVLHDDLIRLTGEFLVKFVKACHLKGKIGSSLKELQVSETLLHPDIDIFLGSDTREIFDAANKDVQETFILTVKKGYIKAGKVLLSKLPIDNSTLEALTFLNPDKRCMSGAVSSLNRLVKLFKLVLSEKKQKTRH